jgi:hypothetical protein
MTLVSHGATNPLGMHQLRALSGQLGAAQTLHGAFVVGSSHSTQLERHVVSLGWQDFYEQTDDKRPKHSQRHSRRNY